MGRVYGTFCGHIHVDDCTTENQENHEYSEAVATSSTVADSEESRRLPRLAVWVT